MNPSHAIDLQALRLDGIYQQRQKPYLMMRIKLAGGILSAEQARLVADVSEQFARGMLHLTTRCSIELHWLETEALPQIADLLHRVGLTSRGACGGAVRGVSVSAPGSLPLSYPFRLATRLQRHFTGNPRFEGLPKKFKIGIQNGYEGPPRYLIQDVGIVITGNIPNAFDVWVAGGLGREPQEGFLLEQGLSEERLLPLVEAIAGIYAARGAAGKRLKHLVREISREEFVTAVQKAAAESEAMPFRENLVLEPSTSGEVVEAGIFAGEVSCALLRHAADIADQFCGGWLGVTSDQNFSFSVRTPQSVPEMLAALAGAGLAVGSPAEEIVFRICPGNHECRLGLSATRDLASRIIAAVGREGEKTSWAISGCPNSCSQPQLADVGIITTRIVNRGDEESAPLFDLYRRTSADRFGAPIAAGVDEDELLRLILHPHS